jgi:hypothetical protein
MEDCFCLFGLGFNQIRTTPSPFTNGASPP